MSERPKTLVELYSQPGRLTKHHFAVDKDGQIVETFDDKACKFCIHGACRWLFGALNPRYDYVVLRLNKLLRDKHTNGTSKHSTVVPFNDDPETTQEQVLELCKEAGV